MRFHKVDHNKFMVFNLAVERQEKMKVLAKQLREIVKSSGDDFLRSTALKKIVEDIWRLLCQVE